MRFLQMVLTGLAAIFIALAGLFVVGTVFVITLVTSLARRLTGRPSPGPSTRPSPRRQPMPPGDVIDVETTRLPSGPPGP
jgi:hypothetical protein